MRIRFPFLSPMLSKIERMSVPAFTIAVFEEFLLLSAITITAVYFDHYYVWLAAFMAFFIHLIIHVIQWMIVRKYIPAIITTLLALPYCLYTYVVISRSTLFNMQAIIICSVAGMVIMIVNLIFAHSIAAVFDKKFLSDI